MKIEKLVKKLQERLSKGENKKEVSCGRIDKLLSALSKKEKKLEQNLAKEKSSAKRKHLKLDLKVVRLQLKKGRARRTELEAKCK